MLQDASINKIIAMGIIAGACFFASVLVLELVNERQNRYNEARAEVASTWGARQQVIGPVLKIEGILHGPENTPATYYVLPDSVGYETALAPSERSRGIYTSVVYDADLKASGAFSAASIAPILARLSRVETSHVGIAISDTRGIEKQVSLTSGDVSIPFVPGSDLPVLDGAGLHAAVPLALLRKDMPFSFAVAVKGSEGIAFAPVGKESTIALTSPWTSPKFSGAFLPTERSVADGGFSAEWRISSFGRSYPQVWQGSDVGFDRVLSSTAGADLYDQTDFYTKIDRSIKYAILFIAVTFLVLFLFETLARIRIHPLQYLLVGAALALFYLLLLSFSEQIGFFVAYLLATLMTAFLISLYCARVLGAKGRAFGMFAMLIVLYGYLYFVLLLEDYALLFGSLLLFVLLATVMYLTRNVNWFEIAKKKQGV